MRKGLAQLLENIGKLFRQNIGLFLLAAAAIVGVGSLLLQESPNPEADVVMVTLDAISTQSNQEVPTIAAYLTQTPQQAALTAAAPTISLSL